jgi:hypothetical protein
MVIVSLVLMIEATVPHYTWAVHIGSGGTPPFSAVEVTAIGFLWRPVLQRLSALSGVEGLVIVLAMIAASWLIVAAAGALAWCHVRKRRRLSPLGLLIVLPPTCYAALRLLQTVSPLHLPF